MVWGDFVQFGVQYLFPIFGPLLGVIVGAWLTNSFFPFKLKRREWRWEKELWANELFFETVSRISFVADHYIKAEYGEKFSMSGLGLDEANDEIMRLVKKLHSEGHKLKLYMSRESAHVFEQYLRESQKKYDIAKESWGCWEEGDYISETQHTENIVAGQGEIAANTLERLPF